MEGAKMRILLAISGVGALCLTALPAAAQKQTPQSPLVDALVKCRVETGDAARLRCYDVAAEALTDASTKGEVIVVDRDDVRKTRRSLFGFNLPKLPFFGGDDSQDAQADEVEAVIKSVRTGRDGKHVLVLDDGSVWQTTEGRPIRAEAGAPITIKRAALGSYFLRVGGRSVKGIRIR